MNWFERHLNWTVILTVPIVYFIAFIIDDTASITAALIVSLLILPICAWNLKKKSRSPWWLLILFVPFGWIVFLALQNRSGVQEVNAAAEHTAVPMAEAPLVPRFCPVCGKSITGKRKFCAHCGEAIDPYLRKQIQSEKAEILHMIDKATGSKGGGER